LQQEEPRELAYHGRVMATIAFWQQDDQRGPSKTLASENKEPSGCQAFVAPFDVTHAASKLARVYFCTETKGGTFLPLASSKLFIT
jgi:hypothetical protein